MLINTDIDTNMLLNVLNPRQLTKQYVVNINGHIKKLSNGLIDGHIKTLKNVLNLNLNLEYVVKQ